MSYNYKDDEMELKKVDNQIQVLIIDFEQNGKKIDGYLNKEFLGYLYMIRANIRVYEHHWDLRKTMKVKEEIEKAIIKAKKEELNSLFEETKESVIEFEKEGKDISSYLDKDFVELIRKEEFDIVKETGWDLMSSSQRLETINKIIRKIKDNKTKLQDFILQNQKEKDLFTQIELEQTIEDIKELANEFEKEGKQIENYFNEDFVQALRTNNFNKKSENLNVLKRHKTKLKNLILINEVEKLNQYLYRLLIDGQCTSVDYLEKTIKIVTTTINKINATNESEKYISDKEYTEFFNKVYYLIKVTVMNGWSSKLNNLYLEINANKEIVKILNSLIIKEIKITEKSKEKNTNTFKEFALYYLSNPINENELISPELIRLMTECYDCDSRYMLNKQLEENIKTLSELNEKMSKKSNDITKKQSSIYTFNETTKPNYYKELKKKIISLFLSGALSFGICLGIEEMSYQSIHNEYQQKSSTEVEFNVNAKLVSLGFGMVCAILVGFNKDFGVFGIIEKLNKLNEKYNISKEYNEELIDEIEKIKEELKPILKNEQETLNTVNLILDEILITMNRQEILTLMNRQEILTPKIKKLTKDASYMIERVKHQTK